MPKEYITLKLTTGTRCRNVETEKAYAIKNYKENVFLPKKHCKMYTLKNDTYRWSVEIPIWLAIKSEDVANAIMYIQDLNDFDENKFQAKAQAGLDMINEFLRDDL
tara:strand:+ start:424 stop:741 length:318 start_codon:yes stop_codon:yes gene_type:complete